MLSRDLLHKFLLSALSELKISVDNSELDDFETAVSALRKHDEILVYSFACVYFPFKVEMVIEKTPTIFC